MRDYLIESGNDPLFFVGTIKPNLPTQQAAETIRQQLQLPVD
jgi:hypothetical protein